MGSEGVEATLGRARSALRDEADMTRAGFHQVEDPGVQFMGNIKGGLDRLKDKFTFLHEYSDEFIKSTGVDVLIKAESTAKKMMEMDKSKRAEDKLVQNREALVSTLVEGEGTTGWRSCMWGGCCRGRHVRQQDRGCMRGK